MAYEIKENNQKISTLIVSKGARELAGSLQLTQSQIQKANSAALTLSTNPAFKNCSPASILKYVYEVARYDFSRDDCVYPVPYGNSIQAQIGYKGFRELALKSGEYYDINYSKVYDCDKIKRDRITGKIKVEFEEDYNKTLSAKCVGYYAYALDKETGEVCNSVYWTKEQCVNHGKTYSKTYNTTWNKSEYQFDKMASKTVIKQLTNELKTTPELESAKKLDGYVYGEGYADNPQNKKLETSNFDKEFDNALEETLNGEDTIDVETGEIKEVPAEESEPTKEYLDNADIREQLEKQTKNH